MEDDRVAPPDDWRYAADEDFDDYDEPDEWESYAE
jgi:hypothetical protein